MWSRLDIGGKKITSFGFASAGQLALSSETGQLAIIAVADGSPAAGAGVACYPAYAPAVKALQCRNGAGESVWDRKGEVSENQEPLVRGDYVIWAAKSGEIEVISRADGASRWKGKSKGNPRVWVSGPGTEVAVAVPGDGNVTVVKLRPSS